MRLYFNPQCSKSRAARRRIEAGGHAVEIIDYRAAPPDTATLRALLDALDDSPAALVRRDEDGFARFDDGRPLDRERVIEVLRAAPALLQRPILVVGRRAVIARPPERVYELLPEPTQDAPLS